MEKVGGPRTETQVGGGVQLVLRSLSSEAELCSAATQAS